MNKKSKFQFWIYYIFFFHKIWYYIVATIYILFLFCPSIFTGIILLWQVREDIQLSFSRRLWFLKGKTWQQDHSYIQRLSSERRSQPYKSQNFYKHGLKNHKCFRYDLMLWPNVKGDHNKMLEPEWDNEHWLNWTIP